MDLRCRKTECLYNNKYTCQAKGILVSEKIICSTYEATEKDEPDTSRTIFEKAPEYAPQRESKTCTIDCKAHCMFNRSGKCIANGITVSPYKEKPYCVTFIRK